MTNDTVTRLNAQRLTTLNAHPTGITLMTGCIMNHRGRRRLVAIATTVLAWLSTVVAYYAEAGEAADPQPVCPHTNVESADAGRRCQPTPTCPVWESFVDGWMLAGHEIQRHDEIPGLRPDLVIPWKRHSRRAFPLWARHHYFYQGSSFNESDAALRSDRHNIFVFAPGLHWPLECHTQQANMRLKKGDYSTLFSTSINAWYQSQINANDPTRNINSNSNRIIMLNPTLVADRTVAFGDPLFLPCVPGDEWPMVETSIEYAEFVFVNTTDHMQAVASCFDPYHLEIRPWRQHPPSPSSPTATQREQQQVPLEEFGVYTNKRIAKGKAVTWGNFIPMHRTELHDHERNVHELLLNYCYGHANSSLLFLPSVPMANAMNHATPGVSQPNVRVEWNMSHGQNPADQFTAPTTVLLEDNEQALSLPVRYVATREIAAGEELLLDYGEAWYKAWIEYVRTYGEDYVGSFRHEIGLPLDMLPSTWLEQESLQVEGDFDEWLLPKLTPGEISPIQLKSGIDTDGKVDRVGFPDGLTEFMAAWAERIGLTDIMRAYILGDLSLPIAGEQRLRLNGTTWWMKRFPATWKSDMHYISPDDYASNNQFMQALSDAGFDHVLQAVAKQDELQSITAYYPSFIAVSHCTRTHMHDDSQEHGHYNVIFPVLQTSVPGPELVLGDEDKNIYAPYKYEPDHAVVLGKDGLHGTAPCDYRAVNEMRMVISVYLADSDNHATKEKVLKGWEDPPFPRVSDRRRYFETYKHWRRNDTSKSLSNPL